MMEWLTQLDWNSELLVLLDVLIAMVLGGMVGLERQRKNKPAGLRTHMLIAGAANVLVFLSISMSESSIATLNEDVVGVDPTRIIQAIIVGVSFIGAGTIFKSEKGDEKVKYLSTAASILFATCIGIGVALNHYVLAIGIAIIALFTNYLVKRIFRKTDLDAGSYDEDDEDQ